MKVGRT